METHDLETTINSVYFIYIIIMMLILQRAMPLLKRFSVVRKITQFRFRPSQRLMSVSNAMFLICAPCWIVFAIIYLLYCTDGTCPKWLWYTFIFVNIVTWSSWFFMSIITYCDLDAKEEAGIIKVPKREKRNREYRSNISKALDVLNKGEKLNAWYLVSYAIAHVFVEFMRISGASSWLWIPVILFFGVPEIYGIRMGKHTFSQFVWVFQRTGGRARSFVSQAWVLWISIVIFEASPGIAITRVYAIPVAEWILMLGIVMWLIVGGISNIARATSWKRPW